MGGQLGQPLALGSSGISERCAQIRPHVVPGQVSDRDAAERVWSTRAAQRPIVVWQATPLVLLAVQPTGPVTLGLLVTGDVPGSGVVPRATRRVVDDVGGHRATVSET
jgi:hypothetical protein